MSKLRGRGALHEREATGTRVSRCLPTSRGEDKAAGSQVAAPSVPSTTPPLAFDVRPWLDLSSPFTLLAVRAAASADMRRSAERAAEPRVVAGEPPWLVDLAERIAELENRVILECIHRDARAERLAQAQAALLTVAEHAQRAPVGMREWRRRLRGNPR